MHGTLKPGGRALIVSMRDPINTGREVVALWPDTWCGEPTWFVAPVTVSRPLIIHHGEVAVRTGKREYRVDELMPLDVDPKNPEDVTV